MYCLGASVAMVQQSRFGICQRDKGIYFDETAARDSRSGEDEIGKVAGYSKKIRDGRERSLTALRCRDRDGSRVELELETEVRRHGDESRYRI
jgi:hypothetical protein